MSTAQVVETSVSVNNNSPIHYYVHSDNQTQPTFSILYCLDTTLRRNVQVSSNFCSANGHEDVSLFNLIIKKSRKGVSLRMAERSVCRPSPTSLRHRGLRGENWFDLKINSNTLNPKKKLTLSSKCLTIITKVSALN